MILMEAAMNLADYGMMGEPKITLAILPMTLGAGFLAAWPAIIGGSRSTASVATDLVVRERSFLALPFIRNNLK